jgi:hypothetical protein
MSELVVVDDVRCASVAEVLRKIEVPAPKEQAIDLGIEAAHLPNFYFCVVAICHQTSPLNEAKLAGRLASGKEAFGWDYLRLRLAERAKDVAVWDVNWWRLVTGPALSSLLADPLGGGAISTPDRRAELLRELAEIFDRKQILSITELYERENHRLAGDGGGLLHAIKEFPAYADPAEKKLSFFLQLMRSECGWHYDDPENLGPPVDYHEIRGHLRIGTVRVIDAGLAERLRNRETISSGDDVAIRRAICEAIKRISRQARRGDPATLHYFFWNIFRGCCLRDHPHCARCGSNCALPKEYRFSTSCLFAPACSVRDAAFKPIEYITDTEYY